MCSGTPPSLAFTFALASHDLVYSPGLLLCLRALQNLSLKNKVAPEEFDETKAVDLAAEEATGEADHRDANEGKHSESSAAVSTPAGI